MKKYLLFIFLGCVVECSAQQRPVIYQMMTRLFGNKNSTNAYYGSLEQNGVGKFQDISDIALDSLKRLHITHIWYTGVIAHASMSDYSSFGIAVDDPDVVKGRAGSPYAIRDYYDVDPDLAMDIPKRMQEFESLVKRTHQHDLSVIIDFIPNHVARTYHSNNKPANVLDFGANDDTTLSFSTKNDFYYLPQTSFVVPNGVDAGGTHFHSPLKDGKFAEKPAKATGNNIFKPNPSLDDWYETIKLNYGIDYQNKEANHFSPIPSVWNKMKDILLYWSEKGVDGFRCDMAEMVPVEFWHWVIPKIKEQYPNIIFIAEAYNPLVYKAYIEKGGFDYLYDKVGMYDAVKKLMRNDSSANVVEIDSIEKSFPAKKLIRFLENHDEERIANTSFAGEAEIGIPGMTIMATLSKNPVMIYFGQEVGESGKGKEGFGGEDGRTTLFDYWGVPSHQQWMNNGKFDGGLLSTNMKILREKYAKLLDLVNHNKAIQKGEYFPLNGKGLNSRQKVYVRITKGQFVLVGVNFDKNKTINQNIYLPKKWLNNYKIPKMVTYKSLFDNTNSLSQKMSQSIHLQVEPGGATILETK